MAEEHHTFEDAVAIGDSALALQVKVEGVVRWVPKKLIHDDSECYKKGTNGTLILPLWFVEKNGWV